MEKLRTLFKEYADELLYKVQWPSIEELQSSTVTVLIASIMIALVVFGMDFVFNSAMKGLYSLVN
ncbi:MAG: preprotein translocase subunit SecE [Bacteroidetes bacterium]|jgi:preprotein translocase subunit SecE|nr:MAG: preprotein translocase subunit SecE [Bacteroidota bacterium]